ncbi:Uncharacterized protein FWK35_00002975 [Aphis craccivora]|uniref:Uncharacterized protein n=1 Tax=Aphis craccivora TaxID=307492 RepID=A0A6G0ZCN5_APHCR|nr:Uncharacterized protein FWK35_00002975 [Aphis craccivora]
MTLKVRSPYLKINLICIQIKNKMILNKIIFLFTNPESGQDIFDINDIIKSTNPTSVYILTRHGVARLAQKKLPKSDQHSIEIQEFINSQEPNELIEQDISRITYCNRSSTAAISLRNKFTEYFNSNEGSVSWQNKYIELIKLTILMIYNI